MLCARPILAHPVTSVPENGRARIGSATPDYLTPWVIAENNGKILCAHCDCVAGLGECCSHVASLLWAVECGVRYHESLTVT